MDSGIRGKMERWLRRQVLIMDEEKGRCKRLVVRHTASGKMGNELAALTVPKKLDDNWINETLTEIEGLIFDDAEGLGGVQTYVILPFFELQPDRAGSRFTVRETSVGEGDPDEVESEPPTKTGILSQMMRHTEASVRGSLMAANQIISVLRHTVARQSETIEKLVNEKMANLETMEKLRSQELERRLLIEEKANEQKRHAEIWDKVSALAPLVINKLGGKNLLPAKQTPTEAMITGLIETISPDQLEGLQKTLRPEQLVLLMEIFQNVQAQTKPPNSTSTPEVATQGEEPN